MKEEREKEREKAVVFQSIKYLVMHIMDYF